MENSIVKSQNDKNCFVSVLDKFQRVKNERMRFDISYKDIKLSVNVLEKFVQGEQLNQVVVTLYPKNEGYTLALKIQDALENESAPIPYEEDELLKWIDNQQLPPVLIELLEEIGAQVFYSGCVFVEIRDLRESESKNIWNVLLKPTPQSILADAQQICQEQGWGSEEQLQLESILCMAVSEPLCLNPNPILGYLAVNRDCVGKQMESVSLQQTRQKLRDNRRRKLFESSNLDDFKLYEFLKKKSRLGRLIPPILKAKEENDNLMTGVQLDVSEVLRLAKPLERPKETNDCSVATCEEYLFETDRFNGRVYLVRLSILQRQATEEYLGQLYVDRDYREGALNGGASCMFSLGSRANVNRYVQQFTEIFTEEGRKSVKITHHIQGHPPRVMYTQSMKDKERLKETKEQSSSSSATTTESENPSITAATANGEPPSGTLTKTALLESLKAGQVTPAIATLVSTLLSSAQQHQQLVKPPTATSSNTVSNGQPLQQSLLKPAAALRPATSTMQHVQLVNQSSQQQQQQIKASIKPTALATLLTTKATGSGNANVSSPSKGKVLPSLVAQLEGTSNTTLPSSAPGTKINLTALMGQVIRPAMSVTTTTTTPVLPTYSQAISQTTTATVVRTIRPINQGNMGTLSNPGKRQEGTSNGSAVNQRFNRSVPALSALLAGTPSADSPVNNNSTGSNSTLPSLLERLQQSSPSKFPQSLNTMNNNCSNSIKSAPSINSSNQNLNVQSINLTGLQTGVASLPALQSIQVSIPGLSVPLSLSVGVSSAGALTSSVSSSSVMGNVRLATTANAGQPYSIPLSVLQIPSSGGSVQLVSSVPKGSASGPSSIKLTSSTNPQLPATNQSTGSVLAQQHLQLALQRQVQVQFQQKATTKPKSKQHNT